MSHRFTAALLKSTVSSGELQLGLRSHWFCLLNKVFKVSYYTSSAREFGSSSIQSHWTPCAITPMDPLQMIYFRPQHKDRLDLTNRANANTCGWVLQGVIGVVREHKDPGSDGVWVRVHHVQCLCSKQSPPDWKYELCDFLQQSHVPTGLFTHFHRRVEEGTAFALSTI